jgi:general secretion pathway protein G
LPAGQLAEISRHIPSTHRPDDTLVFVPERYEARIKREHRRRRRLIAAAASLLALTAIAAGLWRARERRQEQAQRTRRETMAQRELDLFAKSLELFHADIGRYPTPPEGLQALVERPPSLTAWRGPYLTSTFSTVDPWGNDYVYRVFNGGAGYELFTYGPEGEAASRAFLRVNAGAPGPREAPTPQP